MRYPLLVLALLLSLPRWGQAQIATVWDKSYGSALNETAGFTVAMPGGYLLLSNTSYPGTPPVSFNRYLLLVRTNLTGDTLWTKKLVPPSTTQPIPTAVCRDATGNLLVTGFGYEANGRGFLLKLNSTGDTIWTKSSVARTSSYNSPIVAQDGNYAFLERQTAVVSGNLIYSSSVVKVSTANGAVIWRSDLTSVLLASGIDANSTFPTALVGTGNALLCILQGRMLNTPPRGVEATLVLSDATGNVSNVKIRSFSTPTSNSFPVTMRATDGNVLVGRRQMLTKLTPTGDTLWHTLVPPRLNRNWDAASLCEDAQGNYVLAGNSSFNLGSGFSADNIHLLRFLTRTGQLVNDTMLYRPGQTYASTVLPTPTGNLLIGGWYNNGLYGGSDAFLTEWTRFRPLAARPGADVLRAGLHASPNPAGTAGTTVHLPAASRGGGTLTIFDVRGRQQGQTVIETGAAEAALPVAALPPGLYLLRFDAHDGARYSTRLLRQ